jgi:hypothetical protein
MRVERRVWRSAGPAEAPWPGMPPPRLASPEVTHDSGPEHVDAGPR